MERCVEHVQLSLLGALEAHEAFRLMRCSRRLRKSVGTGAHWRALAAAYGFEGGTVWSIRLMRAVLHGGPDCLHGRAFMGLGVDAHALGIMHRALRRVTYVTRGGSMWSLDAQSVRASYLCNAGHQVIKSYVDASTGDILTVGGLGHSARRANGASMHLPCMDAAEDRVHVLRARHVIPGASGHYVACVGGTLSQHLQFFAHSAPSTAVMVARTMMPYVQPAIVDGGIMFGSANSAVAWDELTRTSRRVPLPDETSTVLVRSIVTTGLGCPIVVTGLHVHVLEPRAPFRSRFVCPILLTHNVFSAPRILGELVIGCYVANQQNRWILDATTGRRCLHPYMHAVHGVVDGSRLVAHVAGTGAMVVT